MLQCFASTTCYTHCLCKIHFVICYAIWVENAGLLWSGGTSQLMDVNQESNLWHGIRGKRTTTNNSSPINFECIKALLPKGWDKIPSRNPWLMISYTKCLTYLFEKRCNGDNFLINPWLQSVLAILLGRGCFQGLQFLQGVFEAAHLLPHGGQKAVKRPTLGVQAAQGLLKLTAARWHFLLNLHSKEKIHISYYIHRRNYISYYNFPRICAKTIFQ